MELMGQGGDLVLLGKGKTMMSQIPMSANEEKYPHGIYIYI